LDIHSFAILNYIQEIKKSCPPKEWKWLLRRSRIFEFLKTFVDSSYKDGRIKQKIKFITPWYSEEVYEILQKLEFLDAINEDFNISLGNGLIPCYVYSIGEYGEELLELLHLTTEERRKIERFIKRYVKRRSNYYP
jgi:hypothetical protein